jgi:hypothetical protein
MVLYFDEMINPIKGEITIEGTSYYLNNGARIMVDGNKVSIIWRFH